MTFNNQSNHRRLTLLILAIIVATVCAVFAINSIREGGRHGLARIALIHPKFSPWRRLLNYADEKSFIEMTGFNFHSYRSLVSIISTADKIIRIPRPGRPKLLDIQDEIGLYLFFVNSTMRTKHLSS